MVCHSTHGSLSNTKFVSPVKAPEAILNTGPGSSGGQIRIGRVSLLLIRLASCTTRLMNHDTHSLFLLISVQASDIWSLGCILYQMVYGRTPFADLHMIQKLQAIVNPSYNIVFPPGVEDEGAVDAMKACLRRNAAERPPIIGENGLLNEHCFLNARRRPDRTQS